MCACVVLHLFKCYERWINVTLCNQKYAKFRHGEYGCKEQFVNFKIIWRLVPPMLSHNMGVFEEGQAWAIMPIMHEWLLENEHVYYENVEVF